MFSFLRLLYVEVGRPLKKSLSVTLNFSQEHPKDVRLFAELVLSLRTRFFALLRMTKSEGLRMTFVEVSDFFSNGIRDEEVIFRGEYGATTKNKPTSLHQGRWHPWGKESRG